jgi:hypothetical protein
MALLTQTSIGGINQSDREEDKVPGHEVDEGRVRRASQMERPQLGLN